jgi:hypothetical protein
VTLVMLQAYLWIPFVLIGGALSSYTLAHYALDLLATRYDERITPFQKEIAFHRVRAELSRVLGWAAFLLLGLAAAGWQFDPTLWSAAFFATMFYWFYAAAKAFQMRLRYRASGEEKRGGDDIVTGV